MKSSLNMGHTLRLAAVFAAALLAVSGLVQYRDRVPFSPEGEVGGRIPLDIVPQHSGTSCVISDGTLAVVSTGGWRLTDRDGRELASMNITMEQPGCAAGNGLALFYDGLDSTLWAVYPDGRTDTLKASGAIRFADVNDSGAFAVLTDKEGYKGSVTVYSSALQPLFCWDVSSVTPVCARLSDGEHLAVSCLGEKGAVLYLFSIESETPLLRQELGSEIPLDMAFLGEDALAVMTPQSQITLQLNGSRHKNHPIGGYPAFFGAADSLSAALSTADPGGGTGMLTLQDRRGRILGRRETDPEPLAMAMNEQRILILFPGSMQVYSRTLEPLGTVTVPEDTRQIYLTADGTLYALGEREVCRFDLDI